MRHFRRISIGSLVIAGGSLLIRVLWLAGGRVTLAIAAAIGLAWLVGKAGEDLGYWR